MLMDRSVAKKILDKYRLHKVIENDAEFIRAIHTIASIPDKFENEEVESSQAYPKNYKIKDIAEQVNILRQLFPGIGFADEKLCARMVPTGAEGWFAIPKWQTIAPTYGEAVEKVLAKIGKVYRGKFKNLHEDELGPRHLKQSAKTEKMFQMLGRQQKDHDILVVAAQFGLRHRGRSVRRAREVMQVNEYGLGAFSVGIMLLTHPERLMNYDGLNIDCAGDLCAHDIDDDSLLTIAFCFNSTNVLFCARWIVFASNCFGSVSAFLP